MFRQESRSSSLSCSPTSLPTSAHFSGHASLVHGLNKSVDDHHSIPAGSIIQDDLADGELDYSEADSEAEDKIVTSRCDGRPVVDVHADGQLLHSPKPLLLVAEECSTLSRLFGEISDTDSEERCDVSSSLTPTAASNVKDRDAGGRSLLCSSKHMSVRHSSAKWGVEDGEITDSDQEPQGSRTTACRPPLDDKENLTFGPKKGEPAKNEVRQNGRNLDLLPARKPSVENSRHRRQKNSPNRDAHHIIHNRMDSHRHSEDVRSGQQRSCSQAAEYWIQKQSLSSIHQVIILLEADLEDEGTNLHRG
jgi:hypothetical protein